MARVIGLIVYIVYIEIVTKTPTHEDECKHPARSARVTTPATELSSCDTTTKWRNPIVTKSRYARDSGQSAYTT